ncbi:hypothetical protein BE20_21920 [Sorangium cellulosum]|nr:hypothetical protein BE20_21920 [Sorangium cellulosum]
MDRFPRWRRALGAGLCAAALLFAGCTGLVGDGDEGDGTSPGGSPGGSPGSGAAPTEVAERSMFPRRAISCASTSGPASRRRSPPIRSPRSSRRW